MNDRASYAEERRFRWWHAPLYVVWAPVALGYLVLLAVWPGHRIPRFPADYPVDEMSVGKRDALQRGWRKDAENGSA